MRRFIALLAGAAAALSTIQAPAAAAAPAVDHVSVIDGPFDLCGLPVSYREETDLRILARRSGPDGDWKFTVFTEGWFSLTGIQSGRAVMVTYRKADRDLQILDSDGATRTLRVMNNRTEVWTDDAGNRLGAVHGPISYTLTVSYAGTPSDPSDDYWVIAPESYTVHGNWAMNDIFCDVIAPALT
jgi:hypothetical protein